MKVITLLTDWGVKDYYVAGLKARLISLCNDAQIVDISHSIDHFDILQASYVLSNCYHKFPEGTVHMVCVRRSGRKDKSNGYMLVKCRGHFFIGFDSGIFSLTLGEEPKEIFKLDIDTAVPQFIASDRLCETASALLNGAHYRSLGSVADELVKTFNTQPIVDQTSIRGSIIHVDSFYNVVTNISRDLFNKVVNNRPFSIWIRGETHHFKKVMSNYDDVNETEIAVMYNELGNLFVVINKGRAATLLGLKVFDPIRIDVE